MTSSGLRLYLSQGLDRADERRGDELWLAAQLVGTGRLVPVWRSRNLFELSDPPAASFPLARDLPPFPAPIFLGVRSDDGSALFAVAVGDLDTEETALARVQADPTRARFIELREASASLSAAEAGILAYARALTYWQSRERFCGVCGSPNVSRYGGHIMACTNPSCATEHYPRTDPATIMLVHDEDRALLARKAIWPPGRYSTIAGFVEPGESLEDAVIREVREEVGVEVDDIRYFASQPWPFPQSLMLGFFARATTTEIRCGEELEDARWFTRAEIRRLRAEQALSLPGVDTIARRLIGSWLDPYG
jgi:NAD+ diphosphatase